MSTRTTKNITTTGFNGNRRTNTTATILPTTTNLYTGMTNQLFGKNNDGIKGIVCLIIGAWSRGGYSCDGTNRLGWCDSTVLQSLGQNSYVTPLST